MSDEPMQYYLLTKYEAELLACYRVMSEAAQETVALIVSSQARPGRQNLDAPVKLSLVRKP